MYLNFTLYKKYITMNKKINDNIVNNIIKDLKTTYHMKNILNLSN